MSSHTTDINRDSGGICTYGVSPEKYTAPITRMLNISIILIPIKSIGAP